MWLWVFTILIYTTQNNLWLISRHSSADVGGRDDAERALRSSSWWLSRFSSPGLRPASWPLWCVFPFFFLSPDTSHCHIHSLTRRKYFKCHQLKMKLWKVIVINSRRLTGVIQSFQGKEMKNETGYDEFCLCGCSFWFYLILLNDFRCVPPALITCCSSPTWFSHVMVRRLRVRFAIWIW